MLSVQAVHAVPQSEDLRSAASDTGLMGSCHAGQKADEHVVQWQQFFSKEGSVRETGELSRLLFQFASIDGVVPLHPGLPPSDSFAIAGLSVRLTDGSSVEVNNPEKIVAAQQYNTHQRGYPPLQEWAADHMRQFHEPPGGHKTIITDANSHAIKVVFQLLLDHGSPLLCEEYTYTHALESMCRPLGYRPFGIATDEEGLVPASLQQLLETWPADRGKRPRVLYTVPVGQNPTSIITPLHRKQAIYQLCRQYGLVIVEDDPYWYLQMVPGDESQQPGIRGLGRSYVSLDVDGRVIRLDSFSKFLGPGFRVGWATAAPQILDKIQMTLFANTLGASGLSQVVLAEMLGAWGEEGLHHHVQRVQSQYRHRASCLHQAACQELAGLAEWQEPHAGMFMWVKLLCGIRDASEILDQLKEAKVVVVPGRISHWRGADPSFKSPFIRVSFVYAKEDDLKLGMQRLGQVLRSMQVS